MSAPALPLWPSMRMAVSLHDLLQTARPEALEVVFAATERHRLLGGKTASLLRAGDSVALRDLDPAHVEDHVGGQVAVITAVSQHGRRHLQVTTAEHGSFVIPASLLLVTLRA